MRPKFSRFSPEIKIYVESLLRINPPEGNWTDVALKLREVTAATKVEEKVREDSEGQVIREARLRRRMIKERFNRGDESLEALKEASKSIREMMEAKMRRRREETLIRALETGKLKKGARSMTKMEEEEGIIDEEGREVWLDKEKAEVIANYLGKIYKSRSERKPAEPEAKSEVDEEWITEEEVRWAASKIRSGAASGHDLIHSAVVKFGTDVIVKQLRDSINNMFNTGEFPLSIGCLSVVPASTSAQNKLHSGRDGQPLIT
ncbi:unnamed protein product [Bursaphelenchus okinawaensis]|uniref:Uncharacterized protein n=1 Tax=Bursaphelenchus okinawaensis TaxID=465554 RepID=A0A811LHP6_9BILA|nr:unnamed protein product [Bursaphelenchus okinawaensis]CAG9123471.1 unnamed protein product [Bursaphelenchus okinawaensis]